MSKLTRRVHELGSKAVQAETPEKRAEYERRIDNLKKDRAVTPKGQDESWGGGIFGWLFGKN